MKSLLQHPLAWALYMVYLSGWLWIIYTAYFNFQAYGDGQALGIHLFLFFIFGFIPYLVLTYLFAEFSDEKRPFYLMLARYIMGSIPVVILLGGIMSAVAPM